MTENLLVWPEASYLINHEYKFIYCPIMRVASTSLKKCCLQIAGISYTDETWGIAEAPLKLRITDPNEAHRILQGNEYFKFALVRNPFARLLSAYLATLLYQYKMELGRRTILDIKKRLNLPPMDEEKRITFRHFVQYVSVTENLNPHWKPQYLFLGDYTKFDFIGKFEDLVPTVEEISRIIGVDFNINAEITPSALRNIRKSSIDSGNNYPYYDNCFGDEVMQMLEDTGRRPPYKHFYPPDLKELVTKRYLEDIKLFKYEF